MCFVVQCVYEYGHAHSYAHMPLVCVQSHFATLVDNTRTGTFTGVWDGTNLFYHLVHDEGSPTAAHLHSG